MEKWSVTRYPVVMCLVMSCVFLLLPVPGLNAFASTLVVTTTEDEHNSDDDCSLREALEAADTDSAVDTCGSGSGDDTVAFSLPAGSTITLGGHELSITCSLTITGPGVDQFEIGWNNASRVFSISGTSTAVTISGVTIRDGNAGSERGSGLYMAYLNELTLNGCTVSHNTSLSYGGGIYSHTSGVVHVDHSTISHNTGPRGGGLFNSGTLDLHESTLSHNTATYAGGGLYNSRYYAREVFIDHSTLSDNTATNHGSGISHESSYEMQITNSTISQNASVDLYGGGGIYTMGCLRLDSSTVSGNTAASHGGGLYNRDELTVRHCTITDNSTAADGGGVYGAAGAIWMQNTILAGNTDTDGGEYPDLFGELTSEGYTLIGHRRLQSVSATTGDQVGESGSPIDPSLAPLGDNGGPTDTHALLPGSPALNVIPNGTNGCGPTSTHDQRGSAYVRPSPVGGACDIGAVEVQETGTPTPTPTPSAVSATIESDPYGTNDFFQFRVRIRPYPHRSPQLT